MSTGTPIWKAPSASTSTWHPSHRRLSKPAAGTSAPSAATGSFSLPWGICSDGYGSGFGTKIWRVLRKCVCEAPHKHSIVICSSLGLSYLRKSGLKSIRRHALSFLGQEIMTIDCYNAAIPTRAGIVYSVIQLCVHNISLRHGSKMRVWLFSYS